MTVRLPSNGMSSTNTVPPFYRIRCKSRLQVDGKRSTSAESDASRRNTTRFANSNASTQPPRMLSEKKICASGHFREFGRKLFPCESLALKADRLRSPASLERLYFPLHSDHGAWTQSRAEASS